jgi:hypothetical protein
MSKKDPNSSFILPPSSLLAQSQMLLYRTEDGRTRVEVGLQDETVWMTRAAMAELYQTTPQNITFHLKAIYEEGELDPQATCKEFLQVQSERDILENPGNVSKAVADQLALEQYEIFHQHRLSEEARDETLADDAELKRFLEGNGKLKKDD